MFYVKSGDASAPVVSLGIVWPTGSPSNCYPDSTMTNFSLSTKCNINTRLVNLVPTQVVFQFLSTKA